MMIIRFEEVWGRGWGCVGEVGLRCVAFGGGFVRGDFVGALDVFCCQCGGFDSVESG